MLRLRIATLVLALCAWQAAFGQSPPSPPDRAALIAEVRKQVQSPAFLDAVVPQLVTQPELNTLLRSHMAAIFRLDGMVERMVDELLANPQVLQSGDNARQLGLRLVVSMFAGGMARLGPDDHRAFMAYMAALLEAMPVDQCGALLRSTGGLGASNNQETRFWPLMDRGVLQRYFEAQRRALGAELLAFPPPKTLQRDELELARQHLGHGLVPRLLAQPNSTQLMEALRDLKAAPTTEACQVGRIMLSSMAQMRGLGGELALRQFVLSMQ